METQYTKNMGYSKCCSKREVRNDKSLHQETRKISNNLTLMSSLKKLEKEYQQTQSQQTEESYKDQRENNGTREQEENKNS